jgi:exopolysaccharide production protein ExoZ
MEKARPYFYAIDVIRFLAALSVVGFHLGYLNDIADFRPIWPVTWFGWVGVEIFFVISGFVIANSANGKAPMHFLKGRALRLYPAAWCCATIAFIVVLAVSDGSFGQLLPSYARSIALIPKGPWIDDVYWTLAVEIGFYALIFGLLCTGAFSLLSHVALALTTFSSLCLLILAARHWHFLEQSKLADLVEHSNVLLSRHGCFFALGAWLWISTTRPLRTWECALVAASIIACIGEICLRGLDFLPQIANESWLLAPVTFWSTAVACIFAFSRPGNIASVSGEATRYVRTLGLMTYPLYLVHHVMGLAILRGVISVGLNKWLALASSVLCAIVISWIVCALWEPPIRRALKSVTNPHPVLQN